MGMVVVDMIQKIMRRITRHIWLILKDMRKEISVFDILVYINEAISRYGMAIHHDFK